MMSVVQLKAELDKRGLPKQGNKPVLKERLLQALATGGGVRQLNDTRVYPNPADGFAPSAHWVQLQPSSIPVRNPVPEGYHAPTNRDGLREKDLYEFNETFERDKYVKTSEEYEVRQDGQFYKLEKGVPKYYTKPRNRGRPKVKWLQKHKLTIDSHPVDWFYAMMTREVGSTEKRKKAKTLFQDWTSWTNAKGILTNCGQAGGQYDNWEYFRVSEIQQFIGLIILNGISISPRMEYKFKTQQEDPVNGNDLYASVFGANGEKQ